MEVEEPTNFEESISESCLTTTLKSRFEARTFINNNIYGNCLNKTMDQSALPRIHQLQGELFGSDIEQR